MSAASVSARANSIATMSRRATITVSASTTRSCTTMPAGTNTSQRRDSAANRGSSSHVENAAKIATTTPRIQFELASNNGAPEDRGRPHEAGDRHRQQERSGRPQQEALFIAVRRRLNAALAEVCAADQKAADQRAGDEHCPCGRLSTADPTEHRSTECQRNDHAHDREPERRRNHERHHADAPEQPGADHHGGANRRGSTIERIADGPCTGQADCQPEHSRAPQSGQRSKQT